MARILWKGEDQPRWLQAGGQRLEAGLLRLLWWLLAPLSPPRASALGRRAFTWLGPHSAKHRHVLANLAMVCPEADRSRLQTLARGVWGNIGSVVAEFPHLPRIIAELEVVCEHPDPAFRSARRPCIFVAAHLGNLYMSAAAIRRLGYEVDLVYSPLANPHLDRLVQDRLQVLDCGFITKQEALRAMRRSLKQGRSVGLHVDVRVDGGETFPLLGAPATTTTAPAWLSVTTGAPIVPVRTLRLGDARFRTTLYPPLPRPPAQAGREEAIAFLTRRMNAVIGGFIREHPEQWMCTKRRWPKPLMRERGAYRF